jgi:hypothetical protein
VRRGEAVPGAEARPGGTVSGAESSVRRKGKEVTGGPGVSAAMWSGERASWASAQVGRSGVREGKEKKRVSRKERGPGERERKREGEWACAGGRAGPRGRGEAGRAGLADCLLQIPFPFSFLLLLKLNSI